MADDVTTTGGLRSHKPVRVLRADVQAEIEHNLVLYTCYHQTRRVLEEQIAVLGVQAPAGHRLQLHTALQAIAMVELRLQELGFVLDLV